MLIICDKNIVSGMVKFKQWDDLNCFQALSYNAKGCMPHSRMQPFAPSDPEVRP